MSKTAETQRGHAQGVEVFQRSQSSVGRGWEGAVGHGAREQAVWVDGHDPWLPLLEIRT